MDETQIKYVIEAALLAAGRPLTLERLSDLFTGKGPGVDRATVKRVVEALAADYEGRGIEIGEVSSGYRIQVRRSMSDWLVPLWEEKAPRYTRALLETLALVAYRQPITRAEIEEVRGVVVSTNIMRTLLERGWVRVVGHRDVPGKPAMFGTTREFLDYFGLKKLEELPPLAELKDGLPELSPQTDLIESLEAEARGDLPALPTADSGDGSMSHEDAPIIEGEVAIAEGEPADAEAQALEATDLSENGEQSGEPATIDDDSSNDDSFDEEDEDEDEDFEHVEESDDGDAAKFDSADTPEDSADAEEPESADVIPLRAESGDAESRD